MIKKNTKKGGQLKEKDKVFLQLTGRQTAGWIGIFCFVVIWLFLLGVLVGRGTAPVEFDINALQKELAELRAAVLKKEQVVLNKRIEKLSSDTNFDFHEDLKNDKANDTLDSRKDIKSINTHKSDSPRKKNNIIPQKTKTSNLKKKAGKTKPKVRPSEDKKVKKHTIQVASVKDPKVADQFVLKLKKQGFPAYKAVGRISEHNIWYRIRVGAFSNRAESRTMLKRLKKEYKGALLVNR